MTLRMWMGCLLTLALAACGGSDGPPREVSATIGAAGGTLEGPDGVTMIVPPGALAQDTRLAIARVDAAAAPAAPADYTATTAVYEFTPHGQLFALPVTIRMPYTAPAGADDQGVFMASPGDDWQAQEITTSGGVAEWQRLTLSYGAYYWCSVLASATDPYRCTPARMNVLIAATPAQALTTRLFSNGTSHTLNAEASLRFTINYSAAADCGAASVKALRAGRPGTLLDQPVSLTPVGGSSKLARGSTILDLNLGYADNGNVTLAFFFRCTRVNGLRQSASFHHFINVSAPQPPATVAPIVGTQPLDQTVTAPVAATFVAAASGTPAPTWQWQRSTDGGITFSDIAGATAASYTTPATTVAESGQRFRAVATNSAGGATSAAARLTVNPAIAAPPPFLGRWPAPTMVEAGNNTVGGLLREAQLACSRGGSCIATWARISSNSVASDGIYAARYTTAQGWGGATQLSADRGREPKLALDDDGNAVLAWSARDGADVPQIFVRRFSPVTGWAVASQLSPAGGSLDRAQPPVAVAMNGSGQVMVAYVRRLDVDGANSLWAARPDAGGWTSVRVPGAGTVFANNSLPSAMDRQGRATLVWRGAGNAVWAASSAADGSWTSAVDLSGARSSSEPPKLAIDTDGQAFAVWHEAGTAESLNLRRRPAGAAWEPVQTQTFAAGIAVYDADIAAGPAGTAKIVHVLGAGSVVLREFSAAGGWNPAFTTLSDGNAIDSDLLSLTMDSGGNLTALWRGYENGAFAIYTRSFAPGLGWSPGLAAAPIRLATIEQTYRETVLTTLGDGRAAMLFLRTSVNFLDELLGAVQTP